MTKIFLFIIFILNSGVMFGQKQFKIDTTTILKKDIYNNFKINTQTFHNSESFALDSVGNLKKGSININSLSYIEITNKADSQFMKHNFLNATNLYTAAFKNNNDRGQVKHRYNAACCYVKIGSIDSAFFHLYRIVEKGNYYNYKQIEIEKYFEPLHDDNRWPLLVKIIKNNATKIADELNSRIPKKN